MKKTIIVLCVALLICTNASAKEKKIKYGKVVYKGNVENKIPDGVGQLLFKDSKIVFLEGAFSDNSVSSAKLNIQGLDFNGDLLFTPCLDKKSSTIISFTLNSGTFQYLGNNFTVLQTFSFSVEEVGESHNLNIGTQYVALNRDDVKQSLLYGKFSFTAGSFREIDSIAFKYDNREVVAKPIDYSQWYAVLSDTEYLYGSLRGYDFIPSYTIKAKDSSKSVWYRTISDKEIVFGSLERNEFVPSYTLKALDSSKNEWYRIMSDTEIVYGSLEELNFVPSYTIKAAEKYSEEWCKVISDTVIIYGTLNDNNFVPSYTIRSTSAYNRWYRIDDSLDTLFGYRSGLRFVPTHTMKYLQDGTTIKLNYTTKNTYYKGHKLEDGEIHYNNGSIYKGAFIISEANYIELVNGTTTTNDLDETWQDGVNISQKRNDLIKKARNHYIDPMRNKLVTTKAMTKTKGCKYYISQARQQVAMGGRPCYKTNYDMYFFADVDTMGHISQLSFNLINPYSGGMGECVYSSDPETSMGTFILIDGIIYTWTKKDCSDIREFLRYDSKKDEVLSLDGRLKYKVEYIK